MREEEIKKSRDYLLRNLPTPRSRGIGTTDGDGCRLMGG